MILPFVRESHFIVAPCLYSIYVFFSSVSHPLQSLRWIFPTILFSLSCRMQHHFISVIACNFPILSICFRDAHYQFIHLTFNIFHFTLVYSRTNLILNPASNVFILYLCALFIIFSLFFFCCFSIVQHFINVIVSSTEWKCAPTPNCNNNLLVCKCVRCHVIRRPFPQHWWLLRIGGRIYALVLIAPD